MLCQQAALSSTDFGDAVDQVEMLIRRHEAFEKVLDVQEEKVSLLVYLPLVKERVLASGECLCVGCSSYDVCMGCCS